MIDSLFGVSSTPTNKAAPFITVIAGPALAIDQRAMHTYSHRAKVNASMVTGFQYRATPKAHKAPMRRRWECERASNLLQAVDGSVGRI